MRAHWINRELWGRSDWREEGGRRWKVGKYGSEGEMAETTRWNRLASMSKERESLLLLLLIRIFVVGFL